MPGASLPRAFSPAFPGLFLSRMRRSVHLLPACPAYFRVPLALQSSAQLVFLEFQIVACLQVHPEILGHPEITRKPQGGIRAVRFHFLSISIALSTRPSSRNLIKYSYCHCKSPRFVDGEAISTYQKMTDHNMHKV